MNPLRGWLHPTVHRVEKTRVIFTFILLSTCFAAATAQARIITIRLPALDTPGNAEVGLYGRGLCLRSVSAQGTTLTVDVDKLASDCNSMGHDFRPIKNVKVLLLVPGYAAATLDTDTDDSPIWVPKLVKLPVVVIEGWIDPAPKTPIRLSLSLSLMEAMNFFGYFDGSVPDIELGTSTTDPQGHFKLEIPDLAGDPFIQAENRSVDVWFNSPDHPQPGEAFEHLRLELRQLYSGSRLVLRPNRDPNDRTLRGRD